jgi:hypothetical protein
MFRSAGWRWLMVTQPLAKETDTMKRALSGWNHYGTKMWKGRDGN